MNFVEHNTRYLAGPSCQQSISCNESSKKLMYYPYWKCVKTRISAV